MSYLVNYGTWKKLFEEANQNVATLIENAKKSDEGTEVPSKPAYEPLFAWFEEFGPKGAKAESVKPEDIAKMLEYWAGDSSRKGSTRFDSFLPHLEFFADKEKTKTWLAALGEAIGKAGSYAEGVDFDKLAENSKKLYDAMKELERQGWIIKDGIDVSYSEKPQAGRVYLGARPRNFSGTEKLEKTKSRQWDDTEDNSSYANFISWQKNLNANIDDIMAKIEKPEDETIFYRGAIQILLKDKLTLLDTLQEKAEKYVARKDAKYSTTEEAITNAYRIRVAPKGKVEKTEKTEVISEPTSTTTTAVVSKSIANPEQAKAMFENDKAEFVAGYADALINQIATSIEEIKKTEGFSKLTSITFKAVASTNVIPSTFEYKGKSGNEALAEARADSLINQVINPAIAKMPDLKAIAKVDKQLAPNNSNETLHRGSSKWAAGGNVNDEKYAAFRFSTIMIDVSYETSATSTTPGESVESVEYAGNWKIEIAFEKGKSGNNGGSSTRIPRSFLNRRSSDIVLPCDKHCAAYD